MAGNANSGRKKGVPSRDRASVIEKLSRVGCDTIVGMATIAMNNLPCGVCRGEGRTRYKLPNPGPCPDCLSLAGKPMLKCKTCAGTGIKTWGIRICESCWGTLFEGCSPELRGKMYAELAQYEHSKRKAIELSGPDDGPMQARVTVEFVGAREITDGKHVNGVTKA